MWHISGKFNKAVLRESFTPIKWNYAYFWNSHSYMTFSDYSKIKLWKMEIEIVIKKTCLFTWEMNKNGCTIFKNVVYALRNLYFCWIINHTEKLQNGISEKNNLWVIYEQVNIIIIEINNNEFGRSELFKCCYFSRK